MVPVWMTFSDLFKVMITQRQITCKWYNIQLYLQWPTNRKWYMICRTALFSMTLNDPYPQFQGHAILWRWISQKRYDIQTWCHWNTNRDSYTTYATVSLRMILSDLAKNIQWHEASRGLSATAELLVIAPWGEPIKTLRRRPIRGTGYLLHEICFWQRGKQKQLELAGVYNFTKPTRYTTTAISQPSNSSDGRVDITYSVFFFYNLLQTLAY